MKRIAAIFVMWLSTAAAAFAQAPQCQVPATLPTPQPEGPTPDQPRRVVPIAGYTLALSWSPEHCRFRKTSPKDEFQCGGPTRFGFILHGLWPNGSAPRSWPQYCARSGVLPTEIIRAQLCTTPSVQLIQHEWSKHGTCTGERPARYFADGRALFASLRFPDMDPLSRDRKLTVGEFNEAFVSVNAGLTPDMIRVMVNRKGWLSEVHVCLDRRRRPAICPASTPRRAATAPLRIWRS